MGRPRTIHEPLNLSEFLKGDAGTHGRVESVRILKIGMQGSTEDRIGPNFDRGIAGIHGPPIWSKFLKGNAGVHKPPI